MQATSEPWRPCTLPAVPTGNEALVTADDPQEQEWCNFVLQRPTSLAADLTLETHSVRPEAPPGRCEDRDAAIRPDWTASNRACHRAVYAGHRRRLRVKQFLYDYAPPAFDHPCLWESERVKPTPSTDCAWFEALLRGLL